MGWNFGDILDATAAVMPAEAPALMHGERTVGWGDFDRRTNRLARALRARGAKPGDKVALYMRNRPEYLEATAACFKARLVLVNLNYRYGRHELAHILDDSDAVAVVYAREFAEIAARLRPRLATVGSWIEVDDGEGCADFAESYHDLAAAGDGAPLDIRRSPDDLIFIYTGGSTGMPKGVMWRGDDLRRAQLQGSLMDRVPVDLAQHVEIVATDRPGTILLPACPLMHGTGLVTGIGALMMGGTVVTLPGARFDADQLWRAAESARVKQIAIVGDVFARPMLAALGDDPGRYDLGSVMIIVSSGAMWSREVKLGLIDRLPGVALLDSLGASEGVGFGRSVMSAAGEWRTGGFEIGEKVKVLAEDDREVAPGGGAHGQIALAGPIPVGYYKDPEKSARTFRTIGGTRYSIPGDWCRVEADGTLSLLGRGSVSINTGGEKVFPEEVEEVLKLHPSVIDAVVVGVPEPRWGQAVTGVVALGPGAVFDEANLRAHVRGRLAGYKTPKRIVATDDLNRGPNGKADYQALAGYARRVLGID